MKLTPAGTVFVQEARRALSASERVLERTRAAARGELGKLRLAYTFAIAYETLPILLGASAEDAPEVKAASREMSGADMVSGLRDEKPDLALTPRTEPPADDPARQAIGANR